MTLIFKEVNHSTASKHPLKTTVPNSIPTSFSSLTILLTAIKPILLFMFLSIFTYSLKRRETGFNVEVAPDIEVEIPCV